MGVSVRNLPKRNIRVSDKNWDEIKYLASKYDMDISSFIVWACTKCDEFMKAPTTVEHTVNLLRAETLSFREEITAKLETQNLSLEAIVALMSGGSALLSSGGSPDNKYKNYLVDDTLDLSEGGEL